MGLSEGLPPRDEKSIRVVDISAWRNASSGSEERAAVLTALSDACRTCGFFQLVGHGIPLNLQKQVLQCAETFFALPMAEKQTVSSKNSMGRAARGYETLRWQSLQPGTLPDLKEGYSVGTDLAVDDPQAGKFLRGPNLWPSSLPTAEFETPLMNYRAQVARLAELLLDMLRQALPGSVPGDLFDEFCVRPTALLRLLHYPPQESTDVRQLGAGAHTDFGGLTLLLQQPGSTGLEVFHPMANCWIPVPATEDRLVVNIGDLLQLWTGGYYVSAVHRVINRDPKHRFSAPFFYNGNMNSTFVPLDLSGSNDGIREAQTVEGHISRKLEESIDRVKTSASAPVLESTVIGTPAQA